MPPFTLSLTKKLPAPFWRRHPADAAPTAAELHRQYLRAVLSYVSARLGAGDEAEDVAADVFGAAFKNLRSCPRRAPDESGDPVRAWLFGIARRKVADVYRRRARRPEAALGSELPAPEQQAPEARALAEEAARTLRAILDELPEMQREALRLKYLEELSLVEIGLVLGKSPAAVAQLLHRARQAVRTRGERYFGREIESEEKSR
jgi:RNA polymerase sigma-70 factor (ECF subfamily)